MDWTKPKEVCGLDVAFGPQRIDDFLPADDEIPDEFKDWDGKWPSLVSRWFFQGLPEGTKFIPKAGIDTNTALRHVAVCMGSWEPSHERKTAGCAYLLSLFFEDVIVPEQKPTAAHI